MADKIILSGVEPYDGEYDVDLGYFTHRELHLVRCLSGLRPAEIPDALVQADAVLYVSFAVIAMQRLGKPVDENTIMDGIYGSVKVEFGDQEIEAGDEDVPPLVSEPSGAPTTSSGDGTSSISGSPGNGRKDTGSRRSDTSSISDQETSVR